MNTVFDVAVTLSPAVARFHEIRNIYEYAGDPVPESIVDGWAMLMRVRDFAEDALTQMDGDA